MVDPIFQHHMTALDLGQRRMGDPGRYKPGPGQGNGLDQFKHRLGAELHRGLPSESDIRSQHFQKGGTEYTQIKRDPE